MLGGAAALPFVQDAEKAAETVWGWITGLEPDLQAELRHAIDGLGIWEDAGNDVLHGPRPFGIDVGSGIGFGDLISRNVQSPLDFAGAAISSFGGGANRAWKRLATGQGEMAAARELAPNAVKHMIDGLYPEAGLTSSTGSSKIMSPEQLSEADRVKLGLGFQLASKAQQYERIREVANLQNSNRQALATAEKRLANLADRGQDTHGAMADISRLIAQGVRLGVYPDAKTETARVMRDLKRMALQRAHPELGSRTMQRIEHVRQQQAP
jgi:hypothetical protein